MSYSSGAIFTTALAAGGLVFSATQVIGSAVASPATTAVMATAGLISAICIELLLHNTPGGVQDSCTYIFCLGYLVPAQVHFNFLEKITNIVLNWTVGLQNRPALSFFDLGTKYAPHLAGFSFGYMAGSFVTRTIFHMAT